MTENLWFGVFHKWNQQVEFHFTSTDAISNYPDKVLIRDLKEQSRFIDDDIAFNQFAYWQKERDVYTVQTILQYINFEWNMI